MFMAAVLTAATYLALEQAMLSKIRSDIKAALGDDYAIIALHMEGKDYDRPSLWPMLKSAFLYETNITGEYTPEGSGGFTGKHHYLALLISDNKVITFCDWSFRSWALVFDGYEKQPYDLIENLSESDQRLYSYEAANLVKRNGLFYNDQILNNEKISFYYRPVKEAAMH